MDTPRRFPRLPARALCTGLLLFPLWGQAEVYRWTDAEGNIVFGDRPPVEQPGRVQRLGQPTVQTPSGGGAAEDAAEEARFQDRQRRLLDSMRRDREERARLRREAMEEEQRQAEMAERCAAVREELDMYRKGVPLVMEDAEGHRTPLEDDQRQQNQSRLEGFLARNCQGEG